MLTSLKPLLLPVACCLISTVNFTFVRLLSTSGRGELQLKEAIAEQGASHFHFTYADLSHSRCRYCHVFCPRAGLAGVRSIVLD
ncbi:MAG: hypothetical protein RIG63_09145 [Coleofasciculus chthonoplastes F3-SA18-01]|uniref:hypothetical protein n=1 Tax=Coleofasciculus chthonoplastes TaxID=64178 RepID=UPI0032FCE633